MRFWIAALSVAALLVSGDAALADKRVAFVVGNAAYRNVPQLPNPAIDAKAIAAVLRNVGFEVVEGTNLTRDKMTEKLLDFGKKAEGADVAVFFYAGHGIAVNNTNYLLPIDADLKSEMDVKLGAAINVDLTLEQTMADAKVKLVFLDACRDNPFAARIRSAKATRSVAVNSGLAEMKSGEGTLIAFATGPGQTALGGDVGNHSPFTRALISNIAQAASRIQQAMTEVRAQVNEETNKNQPPWGHTNLIGEVYLEAQAATIGCARRVDRHAGYDHRRLRRSDCDDWPDGSRVLAFGEGPQRAGRADRLHHQLSRTARSRRWRSAGAHDVAKLEDNGQPGERKEPDPPPSTPTPSPRTPTRPRRD